MEETLRILVIDEEEEDRIAVRRSLDAAQMSIDLVEVESCARAITLLQQQSFDGAVLDYLLPDGDGLTLVKTIRQAQIKVALIVLTGQGDEQIAVELIKAGASDYLLKSKVSAESLPRTLRNAIRINRAEIEAAQATERLRASEERYRFVLEGANDGIWDWDIWANQIYCNDRLLEILGRSRPEVTPTLEFFTELCHPEDSAAVFQALKAHLEEATDYNVELRLQHRSGEYRYCIARGKAQRTAQGVPFRMSGTLSDMTERKQVEEAQRFLAEAGTLLAASLNYETTLENLARLAVPYLADWCTIHVIQEDRSLDQVAVAHKDPLKAEWLYELQQRYPLDPNASYGIPAVARTGQVELYPQVPEKLLAYAAHNPEHLAIMRNLGFQSAMCLPLLARGRTLGVITLASGELRGAYTQTDRTLAEELAHRAALAVDNARLYRQAQEVGENLRQAILILGEQQQQLRTLQQLTNLLNQRLANLPELLQLMINAVCNTISGVEFGAIALHNSSSGRLELTAQTGIQADHPHQQMLDYLQHQVLTQVFLSGESQLVHPNFSPNFSQSSADLPALVYAVAIESAQAGRLGVLAVGNWQDPTAFNRESKQLLVAFGEQAAIAINNAQLISTLEEREERLAKQNRTLMQQNLELERQRQRIQAQNLKLLEAAQLKSQFLATMSHELRTPMNAIIGFSQLLLRQHRHHLNHQQADMVMRILNNGKNLLALINDILDLSKIESGNLDLKLEEFNLVQLVLATTEELRTLAEQKQLGLQVEIQVHDPQIWNDVHRLRQVLVNLISNAIKFTETGEVRVEVVEQSPQLFKIAIHDTGIGIAEADLPHIFEEFSQVDQALTKKYPGTGLGLAITDWLIRMMNGSISVKSQLGQGSTFQIELPRQIYSAP